jgi:transcriptional regulator with XRE-family HTH domain
MHNLQQTREALGQQLRELRKDAGRSGYALAEMLGWTQSKISKIENGRQSPSEDDILAWTRATGRADAAPDLLATARTLETMYADWRRQLRHGMRSRQQSIADLEEQSTGFRIFECMFVPGLVQTPEYARALMAESIEFYGIPDDLDEALRSRMRRQEILYAAGKKFHIVITEAVLRYRFCPVDVLAGQLDRLMTLSALRNVRFGIIPFEAAYHFSPPHGFWIYDDKTVAVETISAEMTLTQPMEIAQHAKAFGRLASTAAYGPDARHLITQVLDSLVDES